MFLQLKASNAWGSFIILLWGAFFLYFFSSCKKDSENYLVTSSNNLTIGASSISNNSTGKNNNASSGMASESVGITGATAGKTVTTGKTGASTTTGTTGKTGTTGTTGTGTTTTTTTTTTGTTTYTSSGAIVLQSNTTYSGLSIDLSNAATVGMSGNSITNVHITNCRIVNTTAFAIMLNNCTNVTIDNCFISNVGFGVYAQGSSSVIKVNNNQILNVNGINTAFLGHAIQFNGVSGGGSQINNNRIENVAGVALHPHDVISLYASNGIKGDSIQVIGNWIRGGQLTLWPTSNSGACGIGLGDVSGSYQVCRNNILVNPGYAGIQCIGTGSSIKIDHNQVFSTQTAINTNAINILDNTQIEVSYNMTNWTNHNGINALLADGETQYYLGSPASPTPKNFSTNSWGAGITASALPTTLITLK